MYQNFFNDIRQEDMRSYFLEDLSHYGHLKKYTKGEPVDIGAERYVAIVTKGMVSQYVISQKGYEKQLYLIRSGEIFGEMAYFCGGNDAILSKAKVDSEICVLCARTLEEQLQKHPDIYRQFMHSMTRKFRIVLLQLTNTTFNEGFGQVADALLRLSSCSESSMKERNCLGIPFTHQELANNIGCSRITVTRCLNRLIKEDVIVYEEKRIVIKDSEKLKNYVDVVIED